MADLDISRAFYELRGETFHSTECTRGPWDPDAQHAGPPSALIGRAIERMPTRGDLPMRVARITYEILRPVPIAPLRIETRVLRPGRRIELCEAVMVDLDGEELIRANAWRIRVEDVGLPDLVRESTLTPGPEQGNAVDFFPTGDAIGWHSSMEMSFIEGSFVDTGPAVVWMRMRHPLVAGEKPTPLQRLLVPADAGNGVSAIVDWKEFVFINVELSVHLQRYPHGDWVLLEATTQLEDDGIGRSDTVLADGDGPIGRASQALLVDRRP